MKLLNTFRVLFLSAFARRRANSTSVIALLLIPIIVAAIPSRLGAEGPDPVNLGSAGDFVILSGAAITTTGGGIINGNVGASPIAGSAIGVDCAQVNGVIYAVDASGPPCAVIDASYLTTAKGDLTIAINDAAGRTPTPTGPNLNPGLIPGSGNIGGMVLAPGLYKFTTTALISGSDVTLTGAADDVWIFQCAQDLQLASGIQVILAGGAQAKNIFWQVGTSAVLGTSSVFKGTILANQSVTMQTSSTIEGRALAFSAGVTFDGSGAAAPTAAEIVVEQPVGNNVIDGDIKDFGPVLVGETKDLIFTVSNAGDANLNLSLPISITGLDASLFTVTVEPSTPVLPNGTTTFTVRFEPLMLGTMEAALQLSNNDSDENPFDINLTGIGSAVPAPEIAVEQPVGVDIADGGNQDFGTVLAGGNKDLIFTITNTGDADLNFTLPIAITGVDAAGFTVTVPPSTPVLPNGNTTFTVRFAPVTDGAKIAALQLTNNDSDENPFDINLTGIGSAVPIPEIEIGQPLGVHIADGGARDFGAVLVGGNKDLIFTISNTGDADLILTLPITFTGVDAALFTVTAPPAATVVPGGNTTFTVRFEPLSVGSRAAALQLVSNDSDESPYDINLSGSGSAVPVPEIEIGQPFGVNIADGGVRDFGPVLVGANKDLIFTISNTGNADLNLTLPITFTGVDAAGFTVTTPPAATVVPGGTTTFTVRFEPVSVGAKVAALQLVNNDSNESPYDINLTGNGSAVPVPEIEIGQPFGVNIADGGVRDFGAVFVGGNKDLIFTISNTGDADLNLTLPITFTGVDAAGFTVTTPPAATVVPGGTTTFTVRFEPLSVGAKVAALQLVNNDSNESPYDINLTGNGSAVPVPEIEIVQPVGVNVADGGVRDFGAVLVGGNRDLIFTVTNSGDADLNLTLPITITGVDAAGFTVTVPPSTPVLAGGTTTFTLRFAPLTPGAKVAALQLVNNDSNESPYDINLTGNGSAVPVPEIEIGQPVGVNVADGGVRDFGAVLVGGNKNLIFTVTNTGDADLNLTLPITFTGVDAALFTVTTPPAATVVPGGTTTFTVHFAPVNAGAKVAALQLVSNDSNESPYDINLTGNGSAVPVPEIEIGQPVGVNIADGGVRDFGAVLVGGNKNLTFTISNTGDADLILTLPITFAGVDAALFTVTTSPAAFVVPGGTTTFTVHFAPVNAGAKVAALQLVNNDSNESPYDIILTGGGSAVPVPEIEIEQPVGVNIADGGVRDFGAVLAGRNKNLTFTVTNTGDADLNLTLPITFTGVDASLFAVTAQPDASVVPGGTTTFTVRFAPLTAGAKVAALRLYNNDSNESPYDINLTGGGSAVLAPEIEIGQPVGVNIADGGVRDFGVVFAGGNNDLVFTVTNTGDADLNLTLPITLTGLDAALFTVTTPPAASVVPGGTTTFTLRFAPLTPGAKVAALHLVSNDSNESPYDINLTGSGLAVVLSVSGSPIVLQPQTGLFEQTVVFINTGNVSLDAVRLYILDLPSDVQVYDVSGTMDGIPYIQHSYPVAVGEEVIFVVEYFRASRLPIPQPAFEARATVAVFPVFVGVEIAVDRVIMTADGRFLIEFTTVPGENYVVQYSADQVEWKAAGLPFKATANRVQWYDDGPPKTESKPGSLGSRFYRVIHMQ